MKQRVVTSIIAVIVFIPILFFANPLIFRICFAIISAVSAYEALQCAGLFKKYLLSLPLIAFALAMPLLAGANGQTRHYVFVFAMFYTLLTMVISNGKITAGEAGFAFATVAFCSVGYTCTAILRAEHIFAALLVYFGAWGSDIFALLSGRAFGKTPLIPKISPKKTVEGAIGGTLAVVVIFLVFGICVNQFTDYSINCIFITLLGLFAAIAGQLGDLIMSAIKRSYGVKDFGRIFPGHGGMLDRFDSTLTVAPLIYVALTLFEILNK